VEEYYNLLQQAKAKIEGLRGTIRSICREFIPKMYKILKENSQSPEDARKKIERDCRGIWSKRTILEALPDEAKNTEKQKAGRLRQKERNSAAFSAAHTEQDPDYNAPPEIRKGGSDDLQIKECKSCLELLSENKDLREALTKATTLTSAEEIASGCRESILHFDFHISLDDVRRYISTINTTDCWFNVTIDTKIGKVVAATVGSSIELKPIKKMC
jgi:hypothetical protein